MEIIFFVIGVGSFLAGCIFRYLPQNPTIATDSLILMVVAVPLLAIAYCICSRKLSKRIKQLGKVVDFWESQDETYVLYKHINRYIVILKNGKMCCFAVYATPALLDIPEGQAFQKNKDSAHQIMT